MSKVRLGFIGAGGMGQCAHLRNYIINPDCEVVALAELRPELGKLVAARYGIPKVYATHRELLSVEKLDGLVAIQQYSTHGQILPDLFGAGIPVLIEKPLARCLKAGTGVTTSLANSSAKLFVAYHKRSDPATMFAVNEIQAWQASREMGKLKYIRVTMPPGSWEVAGFSSLVTTTEPVPDLPRDPIPTDIHARCAIQLDAFINYYIHQINLLRHLLGEEYTISYADPSGVLAVGHSTSGVTVSLEMQPYRTTVDWQESALVAFEKGWIKLELPAPLAIDRPGKVTVFIDPGENASAVTIEPQLPWMHAMRQQATHFIQAIRGEKTPLCTAAEALEDLKLAHEYIMLLKQTKDAAKKA